MILAGLLGVGGNVLALLSPEGMLEENGSQPTQAVLPQESGFETIAPFSCEWVVTKRQHINRSGQAYLALDLIPDPETCHDWTLYAVVAGKVELVPASQDTKGYGNHLILRGEEYTVLYAHMASFAVKNGDEVAQGAALGRMGNTGNVVGNPYKGEGIHLHTEVAKNGVAIDPFDVLPQPTEAMASLYKESGQGVVQALERPQPQAPGLLQGILQGLANLIEDTRELPTRIVGGNTRRRATVGDTTVLVVDERTNKEPLDPAPDARLIAQKVAEEIPNYEGELTVALVDRICDAMGCFAAQIAPGLPKPRRIEIDPGHSEIARVGLDRILSHELGHVKDFTENRPGRTVFRLDEVAAGEIIAEELSYAFVGVTTSGEGLADLLKVGDELVVLIFTQQDKGTEVLRPRIERLRFLYPWVDFQYIDATSSEGRKLAEHYLVSGTPTTVLTRGGKEVWTWVGSIEGLEEMLETNRALGQAFMLSGQVPFTSEAVFAGVYGALCSAKGSLGVLGTSNDYPSGSGQPAPACSANGAIEVADRWAEWVQQNDSRTVVRVLMPTLRESQSALIDKIIAECGQRNEVGEFCYVMLDLQSASEFDGALQRWVTAANPQVGFVLDIEWFGGKVAISSVNAMAKKYFQHRQSLGLNGLGIFGVWYFNPATVLADEPLTREWERDVDLQANYASGIVVPIMDGIGGASDKLASYNRMMQIFQASNGGMMGFTWRWGFRYDSARPEEIFHPEQLFWTQQ